MQIGNLTDSKEAQRTDSTFYLTQFFFALYAQ